MSVGMLRHTAWKLPVLGQCHHLPKFKYFKIQNPPTLHVSPKFHEAK